MTKNEKELRRRLTRKFGGYGRRWEVGSETKETLFLLWESEIEELIALFKKL